MQPMAAPKLCEIKVIKTKSSTDFSNVVGISRFWILKENESAKGERMTIKIRKLKNKDFRFLYKTNAF